MKKLAAGILMVCLMVVVGGCAGRIICKSDKYSKIKTCVYRNYIIKNYVYAEFSKSKDGLLFTLLNNRCRYELEYGNKTINFLIDGKLYSRVCRSSIHIGYNTNVKEFNSVFLDKKFVNLIVNSKECLFNILDKESYISKSDKEAMINLLLHY